METGDPAKLYAALDAASKRIWLDRHNRFDPKHPEKWWRRFGEGGRGVICPDGHMHEIGTPQLVETRGVRMKTKLMTRDQVDMCHSSGAFYAYGDSPRGWFDLYFDGEEGKVWVLRVTKARVGRLPVWREPK